MAATLPELTRRLDDDFVNTWYDIRDMAVDNILEATVFSLALREYGVLKPQIGGEFGWTDTVGYGKKTSQRFQEGSTLDQSAPELDTFAKLDWRYFCVDINRSLIDDSKNMGKFQIKSYLTRRMEAARNALIQDLEMYLMQWGAFYATPLQINGLWDIVAPVVALSSNVDSVSAVANSDTYASGTSNGGISRANTWFRNWVQYDDASASKANKIAGPTNEPYELNLVADLDHMYNSITNNQESPNFIMTTQDIFEAYGAETRDKQQIVRTGFSKMAADLGFDTFTFRGATFSYNQQMPALHVVMLNMNYIEMNYHPNVWFEMTNWKETANQFERVAYIVCMTPGLATSQPRRHGVSIYAS